MHKCATVDDLLAYIVDACEIDSVRDALRDTIQTNKGSESRGVKDYVDTVAEVLNFVKASGETYDLAGMMYRMHANMQGKSNAGQVMTPHHIAQLMVRRFHTHRVIDPATRLSYPPKERAVTVTQDDYMRTAVDYYIMKTEGVTVANLRDMLTNQLDGMLYGLEGDK